MKKNKILILGTSSFSGACLTEYLLNKNLHVYGTFNKNKINAYLPFKDNKNKANLKTIKIDLQKNSDIKKIAKLIKVIKPSIIVDFASICMVNESWQNPRLYFSINVNSKVSLLDEIKDLSYIKKYIYISTPEVFGSTFKKIKEDSKNFNPSTPYASSKLAAEFIIKNYTNNFPFNGIIARFSNFYGPFQPIYRLIPKFIMSMKRNLKFRIHGKGDSLRNFIYSDDFCNGIYQIILKGKPSSTYHFSNDQYFSVKKSITKISKLFNMSKEKRASSDDMKILKQLISRDDVKKLFKDKGVDIRSIVSDIMK
jgi:dTDP-glucose 4,6-dehydratase